MIPKVQSLEQIRQLYREKSDACPKCGGNVTKETTTHTVSEICENCLEYSKVDFLPTCCNNRDLIKIKYHISGGGFQVREQCKNCGWISSKSISVPKENRDFLPDADLVKKAEFEIKTDEDRARHYGKISGLRELQRKEWLETQYRPYLESKEWRQKRDLVLKRDKHLCQCCLESFATQVHHKSYQFVDLKGSEPAFDLVAICTPCHNRIEQMKKNQRK